MFMSVATWYVERGISFGLRRRCIGILAWDFTSARRMDCMPNSANGLAAPNNELPGCAVEGETVPFSFPPRSRDNPTRYPWATVSDVCDDESFGCTDKLITDQYLL